MKTSSSLNGSMRKWEPYSAYKDSGLSTSVQIPGHWSMMRLKHVAAVRPSNVDKKTVEGQEPVRLCNYVDVYKNDYITEAFDFMQASATPAQIAAFTLKASDVIITKDSETWDDIAVPAYVKTDLPGVLCGYSSCLGTTRARESERRSISSVLSVPRAFAISFVLPPTGSSVLDSIPPRLAVHCFHCHPLMSNAESLPSSIVKRRRSTP